MGYQLKAITTRNRDLRTGVVFSINNKNILFSCPDGFQRVANLQRIKFHKTNVIFIPSLKPDYIEGLYGFFMSAREMLQGEQQEQLIISVIGPQGLKQAMHTAVTFIGDYWNFLDLIELPEDLDQPMVAESKVFPDQGREKAGNLDDLEQSLTNHQWLGGQVPCAEDRETFRTLEGSEINVEKYPNAYTWYSLVQRFTDAVKESWTGDAIVYDKQSGLQTQGAQKIGKVLDFDDQLQRLYFREDDTKIYPIKAINQKNGNVCYSYVVIPARAAPKLLPKKAQELGCDPRKHFASLKNMQPVTLDNGTVIRPEQCLEPQIPSSAFAVVFLPNKGYICSFLKENKQIFNAFKTSNPNFQAKLVYHSMRAECIADPDYQQQFLGSFGDQVTHILDCPETNQDQCARGKAFAFTHQVKQICPKIIPASEPQDFLPSQERKALETLLQDQSLVSRIVYLIVSDLLMINFCSSPAEVPTPFYYPAEILRAKPTFTYHLPVKFVKVDLASTTRTDSRRLNNVMCFHVQVLDVELSLTRLPVTEDFCESVLLLDRVLKVQLLYQNIVPTIGPSLLACNCAHPGCKSIFALYDCSSLQIDNKFAKDRVFPVQVLAPNVQYILF